MENWLKVVLILCCYGFFKELRPSEPFLTEYLLGPSWHNLTEAQVYYEVYPVWTYSYMATLVLVFLVTDLLRYKPIIVLESVFYILTWCQLLWARGVRWMQFMEFCYGVVTSTEVAYFTYIYAQVDTKHYQKVTSYTRTAFLLGRFLSGVIAQLFVYLHWMDFHTLNYFTLASECVAFVFALMLPSVKTSIYFHRGENEAGGATDTVTDGKTVVGTKDGDCSRASRSPSQQTPISNKIIKVARWLWGDFKAAYTNKYMLKWSLWWAFATCIEFQVLNYIQPLWESIAPFEETEIIYNGIVEAASTLIGALAVFAVGYFPLNWEIFGEATMAGISLLDGLLLLFMGLTNNIWVAYINYIGFRVSYIVLITIANYQVAKNLRADSHGLVFGINMFFSLLLQTIMTLTVIETLRLHPGTQFVIYGGYLCVLSAVFLVTASLSLGKLGISGVKEAGIWETSVTAPAEGNSEDVPPKCGQENNL